MPGLAFTFSNAKTSNSNNNNHGRAPSELSVLRAGATGSQQSSAATSNNSSGGGFSSGGTMSGGGGGFAFGDDNGYDESSFNDFGGDFDGDDFLGGGSEDFGGAGDWGVGIDDSNDEFQDHDGLTNNQDNENGMPMDKDPRERVLDDKADKTAKTNETLISDHADTVQKTTMLSMTNKKPADSSNGGAGPLFQTMHKGALTATDKSQNTTSALTSLVQNSGRANNELSAMPTSDIITPVSGSQRSPTTAGASINTGNSGKGDNPLKTTLGKMETPKSMSRLPAAREHSKTLDAKEVQGAAVRHAPHRPTVAGNALKAKTPDPRSNKRPSTGFRPAVLTRNAITTTTASWDTPQEASTSGLTTPSSASTAAKNISKRAKITHSNRSSFVSSAKAATPTSGGSGVLKAVIFGRRYSSKVERGAATSGARSAVGMAGGHTVVPPPRPSPPTTCAPATENCRDDTMVRQLERSLPRPSKAVTPGGVPPHNHRVSRLPVNDDSSNSKATQNRRVTFSDPVTTDEFDDDGKEGIESEDHFPATTTNTICEHTEAPSMKNGTMCNPEASLDKDVTVTGVGLQPRKGEDETLDQDSLMSSNGCKGSVDGEGGNEVENCDRIHNRFLNNVREAMDRGVALSADLLDMRVVLASGQAEMLTMLSDQYELMGEMESGLEGIDKQLQECLDLTSNLANVGNLSSTKCS